MKIKRFFAADMRQALRQVKEVLGPDAVILSNKSVEGGVELVAARDYDEDAFYAQVEEEGGVEALAEPAPSPEPSPAAERPAPVLKPMTKEAASGVAPSPAVAARDGGDDGVLVEMRREMARLRRMMENELSGLGWREMGSQSPAGRELMRRLIAMDMSPELCRTLTEQVADHQDVEQGWRLILKQLATRLPVMTEDVLEGGGAIAVIGPTGVGKTTTIAKLAARFCLRRSHRELALITTDHYRIGAQEQLHTYGRILDVPVRTVNTIDELNAALGEFARKRLVLIDTAGISPRDVRLAEQLALLTSGHKPIRSLLTLSAATQYQALREAADKFAAARPAACVLTKVDEAARLGGAVSVLLEKELPLAFVADGQRVPEDLHLARAHQFIGQAVAMMPADGHEYSEEYLAMTFGGPRENVYV